LSFFLTFTIKVDCATIETARRKGEKAFQNNIILEGFFVGRRYTWKIY